MTRALGFGFAIVPEGQWMRDYGASEIATVACAFRPRSASAFQAELPLALRASG
jgi:hypothetical protein